MKRFLLTLTVLFSAIFSLVAKPVPTDFGEKVHIGVIGQNAPVLHQVDQSTSVELHWVTQDNYLYDAIGSPVAPKGVTQYDRPIGPLPKNANEYVYLHKDVDGNVNYIGITNDPDRRAGEHLTDPLKTGETMELISGRLTHDQARTIEGMLLIRL